MTKATIDQYQSGSADLTSGVCSRLYVDCDFAPKTHTTEKNPGPNSAAAHPWERNGLGVAPYRLVGSGRMTYQATPEAPVQPGTSCDYCGEGISNVFFIKAACGSHFKVGCDCVRKVSSKGDRVVKEVDAAVREAQKKARQARDAKKKDELGDLLEANRERFLKIRHPRPGAFFDDKTYVDYIDYMLKVCGAKGRAALLKEVKVKIRELDGDPTLRHCEDCGGLCRRVGGGFMCPDDIAARRAELAAHGE